MGFVLGPLNFVALLVGGGSWPNRAEQFNNSLKHFFWQKETWTAVIYIVMCGMN